MLDGSERRLAVYGSLAPGESNAHVLAPLTGTWREGRVRGRLFKEGWGAAMGYPGLAPDERGDDVRVLVFESDDLPAHWARIDAFEGEGYRRVPINVATDAGVIVASIYALADDVGAR